MNYYSNNKQILWVLSVYKTYLLLICKMKTKAIIVYLILIVCSQNILFAQTQNTGWLASFNTFTIGKKTSIHSDVQFRSTDEIQQLQTLLIRSGLNYRLSKNIIATAGYAFIDNKRTVSNVTGFVHEHRIWQQIIFNQKIQQLAIAHRLRLEQRFVGRPALIDNVVKNDGYNTSHRIRYFIRNILPLKNEGAFKKGLFVALQNEIFLNIGNKGNVNGKTFDQNRLYLAAGYRLNPKFDIEAGYMNQYINGRSNQFTNNHVLQLATYLRL